MLGLPDLLSLLNKVDGYVAEDLIDRLNFGVTVYILAFFALLTGSKQHFGNPIQCLAPQESSDSWVDYYHDYCFIQDKLKIKKWKFTHATKVASHGGTTPYDSTSPIIANENAIWTSTVVYYQWVPYVLFLQALFFLFPKLLWKFMGSFVCHGPDVESAVIEAGKLRSQMGDGRGSSLKALAQFVTDTLELKNRKSYFGRCSLTICYTLTKWVMTMNAFGQLVMLAYFIGDGDHFWAWKLLRNVLDKTVKDPTEGFFPRVVRCTVPQLEQGAGNRVNDRNMQCVLMLNFINEKIYTFLYFWLLFVCVINLLSAIRYTVFLMVRSYRNSIADSLLPSQDVLFASASSLLGVEHRSALQGHGLIDFFLGNVLRHDGILLLVFINNQAGGLVTHDLAQELWNRTVQPVSKTTHQRGGDLEFGLLDKGTNGMPWPYRRRQASDESRKPSETDKAAIGLKYPRTRFRSLSLGDVLHEPLLPSAPSLSPPDSVQSQQNFDDATLPLNDTLPPQRPGRGVAFFDNRKHV